MSAHKTNPAAIMSTGRPKCASCAHFYRDGPQGGHCRRFPPMPMMVPKPGLRGVELSLQSSWPPTLNERWCGEHQDALRWRSENRGHFAETAALEQAEAVEA